MWMTSLIIELSWVRAPRWAKCFVLVGGNPHNPIMLLHFAKQQLPTWVMGAFHDKTDARPKSSLLTSFLNGSSDENSDHFQPSSVDSSPPLTLHKESEAQFPG
ncbi:hypothetical protein O181_009076 [Austropuccinia psidii MF-1]|uniref:Uncharacterized protein n=1 Tax=Austropuccinia psidii MF-1 TaxID=1389203 RepID=A0A9Q3GJ50_9BASI|nr:hypothetical protein [Austropuccinia psidii MF-1]